MRGYAFNRDVKIRSDKNSLRFFKLIYLITLLTFTIKCQGQAPDKKELQSVIYNVYKKINDSEKPRRDKYFIIEIKIDSLDKKIKSYSIFQKNETCQKKYITEIIQYFKKLRLDDFHIYDRILIPVYILPSFDDAIIEDYPLQLYAGVQKFNGDLKQYIYETIVIQTFKSVQ